MSFKRLGTYLAKSVELESLEERSFVADGRLDSVLTGLMAAASAI